MLKIDRKKTDQQAKTAVERKISEYWAPKNWTEFRDWAQINRVLYKFLSYCTPLNDYIGV